MVTDPVAVPTRADYYRALAETLPGDALVVTALGNASYLWAGLRDAPENIYLEDAMGLALPVAHGLALAQPNRRVVVVEGDGGLLMHLGALVTVGASAPANLTVLLIRNGVHAASGGQPLTNAGLDFVGLAGSVGISRAQDIATVDAFRPALASGLDARGPSLLILDTQPDTTVAIPPFMFDPVEIKRRFMAAIGARRYVPTMFGGGPQRTRDAGEKDGS